jgi:hypothetical protein
MFAYVSFHFVPVPLVISYLLAGSADGKESTQFLDLGESCYFSDSMDRNGVNFS